MSSPKLELPGPAKAATSNHQEAVHPRYATHTHTNTHTYYNREREQKTLPHTSESDNDALEVQCKCMLESEEDLLWSMQNKLEQVKKKKTQRTIKQQQQRPSYQTVSNVFPTCLCTTPLL